MTAVAVPVAVPVPVPPDGGQEAEGGQHQAAGDQREVHGGVARRGTRGHLYLGQCDAVTRV